jgi:hypothetical protein
MSGPPRRLTSLDRPAVPVTETWADEWQEAVAQFLVRHDDVGMAEVARPSHLPGKRLNSACGAGWRVRTTFLGAVRSLWGAVPVEARGLRHMAPTYLGARDHRPTAVSAPRFMLDAFSRIGDALTSTNADPKAALRRDALARR